MPDEAWWNTGRIAENGHPEYYRTTELNVLITLEVWLDGEYVVFRDAQPTFLWIERFTDPEQREAFLTYWIRQRVGMLAENPERLAKLRRKLLVVEPKDQHDYQRCKYSSESAILMIRCEGGTIQTLPLPTFTLNDAITMAEPRRLGACPCRCHDMQRQAQGGLPRMLRSDEYFREGSLSFEEAFWDA